METAEPGAPRAPLADALRAAWARWADRVGPHLPMVGFLAGFVWDSLTLTRVDRLTDNLILLGYLVLLGGVLVVSHRAREAPEAWPRVVPQLGRLDWVAQFFYGGLYSAYVVFYFRSATFGRSFLFLLGLGALMVANEFFAERLGLDRLRVPLFALCLCSFLLFFIPVMSGYLGWGLFAAAMALAFVGGMALAWAMERGAGDLRRRLGAHARGVGVVLGTLALLDALGVIPPVPFALIERGIFREVRRTEAGYEVSWEPSWRFWREDERVFRYRTGDRVWCFTAVFAPTGTALSITHVWEWWDPEADRWVERSRIPLSMKGGRDGGFRTFSRKDSVQPGDWRVRVVSEAGRELGRVDFELVPGPAAAPALRSRVVQ